MKKKICIRFLACLILAYFFGSCPVMAAVLKPSRPSAPVVRVAADGKVYVEMKGSEVLKTDGYVVYLGLSPDGKYEEMDSWRASYDNLFPETCVCEMGSFPNVEGTYYVKVRTYNYTKNWKRKYSAYSDAVSFKWSWRLNVAPAGNQKVSLHASPAKGSLDSAVEGKEPQEYEICRSESAKGNYTVVATLDADDYDSYTGVSYEDTRVTLGKEYFYKLRALYYDEEAYDSYLYPEDWYPEESEEADQTQENTAFVPSDASAGDNGGYAFSFSADGTGGDAFSVPADGTGGDAFSVPADGTGEGTPSALADGTGGDASSDTGWNPAGGQAVKPDPVYVLETEAVKGHPGPKSTTALQSKAKKNNALKLSWKAVKGVDGYYLYQVTGSTGTRKKIAKVSGGKKTYTWKKREHAQKYQVVVVPYVNVNGREVTGADSDTFSVVMNYYTSPYDDKETRFFGKNASKKIEKYEDSRHEGTTYYSSDAEAQKHMQTIWIRVWDFQSGKSGKKITKRVPLKVHKMVAPSLKKAFEEIYRGKVRFPIHAIGGYDFRWGQHGVGLAVDINPYENAQFKNGKAVNGFYRPGKDPYSIPKDGEVARILWKYGFTQLEGDYMHFSYFGT